MDNPVQVLYCIIASKVLYRVRKPPQPELCSSSTEKIYLYREYVELLRSSVFWGFAYPELHFVCTGLSTLKSYELKNRE
jgi:hypothetical protein